MQQTFSKDLFYLISWEKKNPLKSEIIWCKKHILYFIKAKAKRAPFIFIFIRRQVTVVYMNVP